VESDIIKSRTPTHIDNRRIERKLTKLEQEVLLRGAAARAESLVMQEKSDQVANAARTALTNQAMLAHFAASVSGDNAVLYNDLRLLTETARFGQAELLADLIAKYTR
jgi:hypothetical protein